MTYREIVERGIEVIEALPAEKLGAGSYFREPGHHPCCATGWIAAALKPVFGYHATREVEDAVDRPDELYLVTVNDAAEAGEPRKQAVLAYLRARLKELG